MQHLKKMLCDKTLVECLYDSIDQSQFSEQYESYPVLEEDLGQETTND